MGRVSSTMGCLVSRVFSAGSLIFISSLVVLVASNANGEVVSYYLDNVILDDGNEQMLGTFSWTYDVGDFENGVGQFTYLEIPFTQHDHTDLSAMFDIGTSVEITLDGSVHDDGVDITLFLVEPLTPTSGSALDLELSTYEIGGNGFHDGLFLSGSILPSGFSRAPSVSRAPTSVAALTTYPNPLRRNTTLSYVVARPGLVRLSVHDIGGRSVRTVVEEWQSAGQYSVDWNGDGMDSGLYFVRCSVSGESRTLKLLLRR